MKKVTITLIISMFLIIAVFFVYQIYFYDNQIEIEEITITKNSDEPNIKIDDKQNEQEKFEENKQNIIEITEKNDNFTNTIKECSIDFKRSYPFIKSNNEIIDNKINEKIENYFEAQLFNNDNFDDEYCEGTSTEEISYEMIKENENILSIRKDDYSYYAGAAHPNSFSHYYHFNLKNGEEIKFSDILNKNIDSEILYILILERLNETYEDYSNEWWIESAQEIINEDTEFYIIENNLYIYFNPYDISAYALGPIEISFDFAELDEYLNSEMIKLWK